MSSVIGQKKIPEDDQRDSVNSISEFQAGSHNLSVLIKDDITVEIDCFKL